MNTLVAAVLIASRLLSPFGQEGDPQGLTLTTAFPSQVIPPGEDLNLTLTLENTGLPAQVVDLDVIEAPADWQVHFLGEGRIIRSVYLDRDGSRTIILKIEPPKGVAEGDYALILAARGDQGDSQLTVRLTVAEIAPLQISLEVELPVMGGTPGSAIRYQMTVSNDSSQDLLVNFEALAPVGFEVTFTRSFGSQDVTTLPVKAGQSEDVSAEVLPLEGLPAGDYQVTVRAFAGEITDEVELTAQISGKPELTMSGADGRLSGRIFSGQATPISLVVRNVGSAAAEGIRLSSSQPTRWDVEFSPAEIERLEPGAEIQVTANVRPSDQAVAGDYMLTFRATPESGGSKSIEFRVTLLTATRWGVVGLVLIAAALGVVAMAVTRFGRR